MLVPVFIWYKNVFCPTALGTSKIAFWIKASKEKNWIMIITINLIPSRLRYNNFITIKEHQSQISLIRKFPSPSTVGQRRGLTLKNQVFSNTPSASYSGILHYQKVWPFLWPLNFFGHLIKSQNLQFSIHFFI